MTHRETGPDSAGPTSTPRRSDVNLLAANGDIDRAAKASRLGRVGSTRRCLATLVVRHATHAQCSNQAYTRHRARRREQNLAGCGGRSPAEPGDNGKGRCHSASSARRPRPSRRRWWCEAAVDRKVSPDTRVPSRPGRRRPRTPELRSFFALSCPANLPSPLPSPATSPLTRPQRSTPPVPRGK